MKPCISQATTLSTPFEADASAYRGGGWTAVELWLTKLETFLESALGRPRPRALLESSRARRRPRRRRRGACLLSRGASATAHWDHFRRRLALLQELGVPTLIVAADFGAPTLEPRGLRAGRRRRWARPPSWPASFGVRLALEFQKSSPICACLETALALIAQCGSRQRGRLPRRVPLLHRARASSRTSPTCPAEQPGLGAGLRPERHPARAGRRRRPDLARRGRFPARRRSSSSWRGSATTATSRSRCSTRTSGRSPPIAWPTWATAPVRVLGPTGTCGRGVGDQRRRPAADREGGP